MVLVDITELKQFRSVDCWIKLTNCPHCKTIIKFYTSSKYRDESPVTMTTAAAVHVQLVDPSDFRPEYKDTTQFRDFRMHTVPERVIKVRALCKSKL